jgi:hypothetical protein
MGTCAVPVARSHSVIEPRPATTGGITKRARLPPGLPRVEVYARAVRACVPLLPLCVCVCVCVRVCVCVCVCECVCVKE